MVSANIDLANPMRQNRSDRRLDLEKGFNNIEDTRRERIRPIADVAGEFLKAYTVRHTRSATFAMAVSL